MIKTGHDTQERLRPLTCRRIVYVPLIVAVLCLVLVSGRAVDSSGAERVNAILEEASGSFYSGADGDAALRMVLEEAVAIGETLGGRGGFPVDSLESMERYLGHLSYREGKWDEAIHHYKKAKEWNERLKKKTKNKILQDADYLFFMASLYYKSGSLDQSEKYYNDEIECLTKLNSHHIYLSDIYNNIGLIYIDREDYYVALLYFMHSLQILELNGGEISSQEYQNCVNNIGTCLFELEMYQYANKIFNYVLENIENKPTNLIRTANQYQNIATVYSAMGDIENARNFYNKSLHQFSRSKQTQKNYELQLLLNYGKFLIKHDTTEARLLVHKIRHIFHEFENISNLQQLQIYLLFGDYYKKIGESDSSINMYTKVLMLNSTLINDIKRPSKKIYPSLSAQAYFEIGEMYYDLYCTSKKTEFLQNSISCFDSVSKYIQSSITSMIDNTSQILLKDYTYDFIKLYTSAIIQFRNAELIPQLKFDNKLLWLSDFCKYDILQKTTRSEALSNLKLKKIVYDFISQYLYDYSISDEYLQDQFYTKLISEIYSSTTPPLHTIRKVDSYVDDLNDYFKENDSSIILNYIHSKDSMYCYVFDNKGYDLVNLGLLQSIEDSINSTLISIRKYMPMDQLTTKINNLSEMLVFPLGRYINKKKKCILIGEGSSAKIPMECLWNPNSSKKFLIQDVVFEYEFNLSLFLSDTIQYQYDNKKYAGFAPMSKTNLGSSYLPYSVSEIKSIKRIVEPTFSKVSVFLGEKAKISEFNNALQQYSHVHLSTHSRKDSIFQNTNFLFLKGRKSIDYFRHWDTYTGDIVTNHLVLSTCYSGSGIYYKGEGIDSFVRLFYQLGIDNIVYTEYQLSDKFAELFFTQYYINYVKSNKTCKALQKSKQYCIENTKYSHPFFWYCIKSI